MIRYFLLGLAAALAPILAGIAVYRWLMEEDWLGGLVSR